MGKKVEKFIIEFERNGNSIHYWFDATSSLIRLCPSGVRALFAIPKPVRRFFATVSRKPMQDAYKLRVDNRDLYYPDVMYFDEERDGWECAGMLANTEYEIRELIERKFGKKALGKEFYVKIHYEYFEYI